MEGEYLCKLYAVVNLLKARVEWVTLNFKHRNGATIETRRKREKIKSMRVQKKKHTKDQWLSSIAKES